MESTCLINEDWLGTVISVAITFVVFIMGIPALIFQTFVDDPYRNIYNERFQEKWSVFYFQICCILFLILLSYPAIQNNVGKQLPYDWILPTFIFIVLILILWTGWNYLQQKFKNTRNIEHKLSERIVKDALDHYQQEGQSKKFMKDLEDLGYLAKELPAGSKKEAFLSETEKLLEYLIKLPDNQRSPSLVRKILKDIICLSVTYDGAKFNHENVKKVMDLISFTYFHSYKNGNGKPTSNNSNLDLIIVECMKEIGLKAIANQDLSAVMDAVDKLTEMKSSTADDLFTLGSKAMAHHQPQAAVTVALGLRKGVQSSIHSGKFTDFDRRTFYLWIGLLAKMYRMPGATQLFVKKQTDLVFNSFGKTSRQEINNLFKEAQRHFYQQADFQTMDALTTLEQDLFTRKKTPTT